MKYKVGDKVRIKTWEGMEKEFGLNINGNIQNIPCFLKEMEEWINKDFPDRILTIKEEIHSGYKMEELRLRWGDDMIECLAKEYKEEIHAPILSRFELLDL